ncbi:hypothetical protein HanXRQr2_Chr04g0171041 [Helianthus annuus]|nr:hypothetical protein HanXRQr2_Chr04g0171041 [Helianthus annuus]KAJ0931677.1 hypothetical protein HanPSC8_Chr04g0164631 [Helianthus annuus]
MLISYSIIGGGCRNKVGDGRYTCEGNSNTKKTRYPDARNGNEENNFCDLCISEILYENLCASLNCKTYQHPFVSTLLVQGKFQTDNDLV